MSASGYFDTLDGASAGREDRIRHLTARERAVMVGTGEIFPDRHSRAEFWVDVGLRWGANSESCPEFGEHSETAVRSGRRGLVVANSDANRASSGVSCI